MPEIIDRVICKKGILKGKVANETKQLLQGDNTSLKHLNYATILDSSGVLS